MEKLKAALTSRLKSQLQRRIPAAEVQTSQVHSPTFSETTIETTYGLREIRNLSVPPRPSAGLPVDFGIKAGYQPRATRALWSPQPNDDTLHQPEVYTFAAELARAHGCKTLVDIGSGDLRKLAPLHSEFRLIAVDLPELVNAYRSAHPEVEWISWNLENPSSPLLDDATLRDAVIICSDVIEHLLDPVHLLSLLERWLHVAPAGVISTPERDLARGYQDFGPPFNPLHIREWNRAEFSTLLSAAGLREIFSGLTVSNNKSTQKNTILSVVANANLPALVPAPDDYRVIALVAAYNEADVIAPTLARLISHGIDICFIDNWSSDGTYEIAQQFMGKGVIHLERFPPEGRSEFHEWPRIVEHKEALSRRFRADWYIHHDADEVLEAPWHNVKLKDALYLVDRWGYNVVNFAAVNFRPVDESFRPERDYADQFHYFEFGRRQWYSWLTRAWKHTGQASVNLAEYVGHMVSFEGRRIFPYRFLLRHYPIRSTAQGARKIFQERVKPREVYEAGIGVHYAGVKDGSELIRQPKDLLHFDASFYPEYLVERLIYQGHVIDRFHDSLGY